MESKGAALRCQAHEELEGFGMLGGEGRKLIAGQENPGRSGARALAVFRCGLPLLEVTEVSLSKVMFTLSKKSSHPDEGPFSLGGMKVSEGDY